MKTNELTFKLHLDVSCSANQLATPWLDISGLVLLHPFFDSVPFLYSSKAVQNVSFFYCFLGVWQWNLVLKYVQIAIIWYITTKQLCVNSRRYLQKQMAMIMAKEVPNVNGWKWSFGVDDHLFQQPQYFQTFMLK